MQNEFCFFIIGLDSSIGFTESSPAYTVEFTIAYKKCVLNYDFNKDVFTVFITEFWATNSILVVLDARKQGTTIFKKY